MKTFSYAIDGTPGWIVPLPEVPDSYWNKYEGAFSMGLPSDRQRVPETASEARMTGLMKSDCFPGSSYNKYRVWIAAADLEPERNEWGEVAP